MGEIAALSPHSTTNKPQHLQSTISLSPTSRALPPEHLRHQGPPTRPMRRPNLLPALLTLFAQWPWCKDFELVGGRWLHQVNAAHAQSKGNSKLFSLCSTQPHIRGPPTNPSLLWGEKPLCGWESCKSPPESEYQVCTHSRPTQLRKKRDKRMKGPV